jgi:UDP-galactose-lipid carrier transferase
MNSTTLAQVPLLARHTTHGALRNGLQWLVMLLGDFFAFAVAAAIAIAVTLPPGKMSWSNAETIWLSPSQWGRIGLFAALVLMWLLWFGTIRQAYTRRKPFWTELKQLVMGLAVFGMADLALLALTRIDFAQTWWAIAWFSLLILLPGARQTGRKLLRLAKLWQQPTVIIGRGENAHQAFLALQSEPAMGFEVVAFVWPSFAQTGGAGATPVPGIPSVALGPQPEATRQLLPFHCVIALEADEWELRDTVIRQLVQCRVTDVHVIPAMRGVPLYGMETSYFFSHEVLLIQLRNNLANPLRCALKRAFDLLGSMTLLLLLSPLFALLAYKVSRDGGNPFFGHKRVGRDGKPFRCLKFRSMVINAQEVLRHLLDTDPFAKAEWEKDFKLKNDPRINKVGHFLRRTSLDELPQLWNVLKGEMSLVGPRPVVQAELERYGDDVAYYLMAKPGMTGLWQVSGRNDVDYAARVYLDSWYVKNWSLWSDIAILFKTISVVTNRCGAY